MNEQRKIRKRRLIEQQKIINRRKQHINNSKVDIQTVDTQTVDTQTVDTQTVEQPLVDKLINENTASLSDDSLNNDSLNNDFLLKYEHIIRKRYNVYNYQYVDLSIRMTNILNDHKKIKDNDIKLLMNKHLLEKRKIMLMYSNKMKHLTARWNAEENELDEYEHVDDEYEDTEQIKDKIKINQHVFDIEIKTINAVYNNECDETNILLYKHADELYRELYYDIKNIKNEIYNDKELLDTLNKYQKENDYELFNDYNDFLKLKAIYLDSNKTNEFIKQIKDNIIKIGSLNKNDIKKFNNIQCEEKGWIFSHEMKNEIDNDNNNENELNHNENRSINSIDEMTNVEKMLLLTGMTLILIMLIVWAFLWT